MLVMMQQPLQLNEDDFDGVAAAALDSVRYVEDNAWHYNLFAFPP